MAVLFATGFEAGSVAALNSGAWIAHSLFPTITSTAANLHRDLAGIGSNYGLDFGTTSHADTVSFLSNTARWVHAWYKPKPSFAYFRIVVGQSGGQQASVWISSAGDVVIRRGSTTVATFVGVVDATVAHWVAVFFDCRESPNGAIEVWVDGVQVATFSGDTRNTTTDQWDSIGFGYAPLGASALSANHYLDDVIVTDAATGRLGELFGCPIRPDGAGDTTGLTPSAGSNWQNVDEAPQDDANYNAATASGQADLYALEAAPSATSIAFVNVVGRVAGDGTINRAELSVKSGATTSYGTAEVLPGSPAYLQPQRIIETDPNTGFAWTQGGVGALQAGVRFTAV